MVLLWRYEERIKNEWGMQQGTCLQVLRPYLHMLVLCGMNTVASMAINIDMINRKMKLRWRHQANKIHGDRGL